MAATVNYATGRAYVTHLGGRAPGEMIGVIESTGYTAQLPLPPRSDERPRTAPETRELGVRLAVCAPLAAWVTVLAMVPAVQFTGWQWVSLLLAAPVAVWGAWPLHRAAWVTRRRRWTRWSASGWRHRSAGRCMRCWPAARV